MKKNSRKNGKQKLHILVDLQNRNRNNKKLYTVFKKLQVHPCVNMQKKQRENILRKLQNLYTSAISSLYVRESL